MKRIAGWVAAAALVLPMVLAAPSANAAGTADRWSVQYESAKEPGPISTVLALGRKDIWAFGETSATRALHWTGTRWRTARLPRGFWVTDAAASSATDMWLTGNTSTREEILHYNGRVWNSIPVPAPSENYPSDLAVINVDDVWAVGSYSDCSGVCTVLLHWNGRTWSDVTVRAGAAQLQASPTGQLWAVGSSKLNQYQQPIGRVLAYIWTGKSWRYVTGIPHRGNLATCCGFTVAANNDVWIQNAHWNGRHWSLVRIPVGMPAESTMLDDGTGGVWFGPWAHWMGGDDWINALMAPYMPARLTGFDPDFQALARIPGTTTVVGTGFVGGGTTERAVIMAFGKML